MLDENLPTFYLKPSPDSVKHHRSFYLTQHGSQPEPAYSLHQPDPSSPSARNCYATALFDAYNPDILYGEVLLRPGWTQPSISQEDIRRNGGVPPAPEPIMPTEFTIQLYDPDQQIAVRKKTGFLGGSLGFEFSMPQQTFRSPSASTLDRTQSDPAANATTPLINFVWRKESKLSKDLTCFVTGKSTDPKRKKHKDPDIAVALFSGLKEVTIYEPNLYRVDMEDPKGLEVTLLLGAAAIRDVFFGNNTREVFNLADNSRKNSGGITTIHDMGRKKITPPPRQSSAMADPAQRHNRRLSQDGPYPRMPRPGVANGYYPNGAPVSPPSRNDRQRQSLPPLQTQANGPPRPRTSQAHRRPEPQADVPPRASSQQAGTRIPPADPRSQWEIDRETARLKAEQEAEQRAEAARRKARKKAEEEETKRLKKMVEQEEKEARRKQAAIDKETERLRRQYAQPPPARPHSHPFASHPAIRPHQPQPQPQPQPYRPHPSLPNRAPQPVPPRQPQPQRPSHSPYMHPPGAFPQSSTASFFGLGGGQHSLRPMSSHVKLSKKISTLW